MLKDKSVCEHACCEERTVQMAYSPSVPSAAVAVEFFVSATVVSTAKEAEERMRVDAKRAMSRGYTDICLQPPRFEVCTTAQFWSQACLHTSGEQMRDQGWGNSSKSVDVVEAHPGTQHS